MPVRKPVQIKPATMAQRDWEEGRDRKSKKELKTKGFSPEQIIQYKKTYREFPALSLKEKLIRKANGTGKKAASKKTSESAYNTYMESIRSVEEKEAFKEGYNERKKIQQLREKYKFDNQVVTVPQSPTEVSTSVDTNQTSPFLPLFSRGNSYLSATSAVLNSPSEGNSDPIQANLNVDEQLIKMIFENTNNALSFLQQQIAANNILQQKLIDKDRIITQQNQIIEELENKLKNQNQKFGSSYSAFRTFKH